MRKLISHFARSGRKECRDANVYSEDQTAERPHYVIHRITSLLCLRKREGKREKERKREKRTHIGDVKRRPFSTSPSKCPRVFEHVF